MLTDFFSKEKSFYFLIVALVGTHFVFRGLLYSGAATDDAEQLLFSQEFRLGYDTSNPPLYTWLVIFAQWFTGIKIMSVSLVKFFSYGLIFIFFYHCAISVLRDKFLSSLATISIIWFYYLGWDAVLSYSHSVFSTCLILASIFVIFKIIILGHFYLYIILGVVMGLGLLSKYTFVIFIFSFIASGILTPQTRGRFLNPMMLLSIVIMGIIFLPHGLWVLERTDLIEPAITQKFKINNLSGFFVTRLQGVLSLISASISFLSPLWVLLCICFWRCIKTTNWSRRAISPLISILTNYFWILAGFLIFIILIFGVTKVRVHYMFVLIPAPIVFFALIQPSLKTSGSKYFFSYAIVLGLFLTSFGIVIKYLSEPIRCSLCQLIVPYSDLKRKFEEIGFYNGTIFAYYYPHDIAGNLRVAFPAARIISSKFPRLSPKANKVPGQCLVVWTPKPQGSMNGLGMAQMLNKYLKGNLPVSDWSRNEDKVPERFINFAFDRNLNRVGKFGYMLFQRGVGDCK